MDTTLHAEFSFTLAYPPFRTELKHPASPSSPLSHGSIDDDGIGCSHHKATLTECGHEECLSPEELRALSARRTLMWASIFCFFFMCCEIIGGWLSNSLAIITDAAHLLSDLASFLISIMSLIIARKTPTSSLSFGFHRAEILGAILSVLIIWLMTGGLLYEAYQRLIEPQPINGRLMFIVATLGLAVNLGMGLILLQSGHGHSHGLGGGHHGHSHGDDDDHGDEESHGHSHGKNGHGHSHGGHSDDEMSSAEVNAKTSLLQGQRPRKYGSNDSAAVEHSHSHAGGEDHEHEHGHGHGHSHEHHEHEHGHGHDDDNHSHNSHNSKKLSLWDRIFHNPGHNINVRAALVHALGDALQSLGVMIAAALIWWKPSFAIADPICTVLFSIIVLFTTIRIMREAVLVLMEATPDAIDATTVANELRNIPGVLRIHDLHIWSLSIGHPALSVHITIDPIRIDNADALQAAQELLSRKYRITHTTIQIETLTDAISCNNSNPRQCVKA